MIAAFPKSVQRLLGSKLLSGAVVVAAMTLGVKGIAFIKELFVAHRFGTSDHVDAFVVAMLIPAVVSLAVGSAFRDAFLPVYSESKLKSDSNSNPNRLLSNTVWSCGALLIAISFLTVLFSGPLTGFMGKGFSPEKQELCGQLLEWVAIYTFCVGLGSVLKGYLQAHEQFALSAIAPVMIPGCTILVLLLMPGNPTGMWLALGTGVGSVVMFAILWIGSRRAHQGGLLERPGWDDATRSVLRNIAPLLVGAGVIEMYLVVDTMMVAVLPAGSVAILTYGERICGVFNLVGIAVVQALFPHISDLVAKKSWKSLVSMLRQSSAMIVVCSLPVVLACWFLAVPIVRFVFERGVFTPEDTVAVAEVLKVAGLQVPGAVLLALAARAVMALRANHIVLIAAVIGLAVNVGLNVLFIRWYGVKGVALSTAMVNVFSASLLFAYATLRLRGIGAAADDSE